VVDAAGVARFPLLGISQGCAVSVAYAVRHPERVSHLILYGGFAVGANKSDSPDRRERYKAMTTLTRLGWGADNPALRQIFAGLFIPGATQEQMDFFNELQRRTTSPECAARHREVVGDFDVCDLLQPGPLCCLRAELLRHIAELSQSPPSFPFSVLGRQRVG